MFVDNVGSCVSVELLDSNHHHSLQSWCFEAQELIKIGRADEQDVTISNPHVSRLHAELSSEIDGWCVKSLGRNGVLLNGDRVDEARLTDGSVIRLGSTGPALRFRIGRVARETATMNEESSQISGLFIDESRKEKDVEEIVNNDFFQDLKQRADDLRRKRDA